jgi:hypothetical protein
MFKLKTKKKDSYLVKYPIDEKDPSFNLTYPN